MKFYIGSDHAGYKTKEALKKTLVKKRIEAIDLGVFDETVADYPNFAKKVALKVKEDKKGQEQLVELALA